MITYAPLNKLLASRGISRTELAEMIDISSVTLAKLGKNESVNLTVIDKICVALDCKIEDVVRIIPESKESYFANLEQTQIVNARLSGIRYTTFVISGIQKHPERVSYVVRPVLSKRPGTKRNSAPVASYAEMDAILDDRQITAFILNGPNTEFSLPSSQIISVCGSVLYSGEGFALAIMSDAERAEVLNALETANTESN